MCQTVTIARKVLKFAVELSCRKQSEKRDKISGFKMAFMADVPNLGMLFRIRRK